MRARSTAALAGALALALAGPVALWQSWIVSDAAAAASQSSDLIPGAAALAPENTLASIRAAAESGVSWVEVDAKLSRDRVPVKTASA